jgi:hypothetical protein
MNAANNIRLFHSWLSLLLGMSVVLLVIALLIGLTKATGLAYEEVYANLSLLESERTREDDLIARDRALIENFEGKEHVMKEVMEGRLTLHEAAAQFQMLNLMCSEYNWNVFRRLYPGQTDEQRHCRQVLAFLWIKANQGSGPAYDVAVRLESEFKRELT